MKKVLGVDPGLASVGYGLVSLDGGRARHLAHGVITTAPEQGTGDRLKTLFHAFCGLVDRLRPDEAAIEEIYFAKNSKTYLGVAQAKGALLLALAERNVPAFEYSPLEIKRAVAGNGRAEKGQVQELVRLILGLKEQPSPDHAADALAAAICHGHRAQLRRLTSKKGNHGLHGWERITRISKRERNEKTQNG
ncbi:MAG: crossover junction endodeoxyribonuclease RuvC [Spirochaetales bacterium]|nr:crossover junction endodeoxyribonuclease RuvC [Spirochaetales bacterium]